MKRVNLKVYMHVYSWVRVLVLSLNLFHFFVLGVREGCGVNVEAHLSLHWSVICAMYNLLGKWKLLKKIMLQFRFEYECLLFNPTK